MLPLTHHSLGQPSAPVPRQRPFGFERLRLPLSPDTPAANGYGPNMSGNPEPFGSGSGFLHLPQRFHNRASLVPNLSDHNEAVGESGAKG